MSKKSILIVVVVLLVLAFLGGFLLEYREVQDLEASVDRLESDLQSRSDELQECQFQAQLAQLRDLAGQVYLQVNQSNYEVASDYSTRYFNHLRQVIDSAPADLRPGLENIMNRRDAVTAQLARAEPGVRSLVEEIYARTYSLTKPDENIPDRQEETEGA